MFETIKNKKIIVIAGIVNIFLTSAATIAKPIDDQKFVVQIQDQFITLEEIKKYRDFIVRFNPNLSDARFFLREFLKNKILAYTALSKGFKLPAEQASAIQDIEDPTLKKSVEDAMLGQIAYYGILNSIAPQLPEVLKESYSKQREGKFQLYTIRNIILKNDSTAGSKTSLILQSLQQGKTFEELAKEFSIAANSKQGGIIETNTIDQLPKLYQKRLWAQEEGAIIQIEDRDTKHIVKLISKSLPKNMEKEYRIYQLNYALPKGKSETEELVAMLENLKLNINLQQSAIKLEDWQDMGWKKESELKQQYPASVINCDPETVSGPFFHSKHIFLLTFVESRLKDNYQDYFRVNTDAELKQLAGFYSVNEIIKNIFLGVNVRWLHSENDIVSALQTQEKS